MPQPIPARQSWMMIEGKRKVITWSLVLVAAQIADALSTRAVFAALPGASEANPLIAAAQAHLGSAWWLPKVGVALMLMLLLRYRPQRRMVLVISLVSTVPSLLNLANLWWG